MYCSNALHKTNWRLVGFSGASLRALYHVCLRTVGIEEKVGNILTAEKEKQLKTYYPNVVLINCADHLTQAIDGSGEVFRRIAMSIVDLSIGRRSGRIQTVGDFLLALKDDGWAFVEMYDRDYLWEFIRQCYNHVGLDEEGNAILPYAFNELIDKGVLSWETQKGLFRLIMDEGCGFYVDPQHGDCLAWDGVSEYWAVFGDYDTVFPDCRHLLTEEPEYKEILKKEVCAVIKPH